MKHAFPSLLICAAATTAPAQTEVDPNNSPALAAIAALDGPEKAKIFAEETGRRKRVMFPHGALASTLAAIRLTERGEEGQEFNLLLDEDGQGGPDRSSYRHQLSTIRKFLNLSYMTWLSPQSSKRPANPLDWDEFLQFFGDCYNNKMMWNAVHRKQKVGRVGPYRSFKQRHKWTASVRSYFAKFSDPAGCFRQLVDGLNDGAHTLTYKGRKIAEGEVRDGEMTGPWVFFYKSGKVKKELECVMVDSQMEGEVKQWHPNGNRRSEATYRAGVPHGHYASYYQNGMISAEGQMVDGKREGAWRTYKYGDPTPTTVVYKAGAVAPAAPPK